MEDLLLAWRMYSYIKFRRLALLIAGILRIQNIMLCLGLEAIGVLNLNKLYRQFFARRDKDGILSTMLTVCLPLFIWLSLNIIELYIHLSLTNFPKLVLPYVHIFIYRKDLFLKLKILVSLHAHMWFLLGLLAHAFCFYF